MTKGDSAAEAFDAEAEVQDDTEPLDAPYVGANARLAVEEAVEKTARKVQKAQDDLAAAEAAYADAQAALAAQEG